MRFRQLWICLTTCAFLILLTHVEAKAQPGTLTNISISSSSTKAGEGAIYTFDFTTSATGNGFNLGLPKDGKIRIKFPEEFDISQISIAHSMDGSINGGFSSISITTVGADTFVDLSRDNTGNNLGGLQPLSVSLATVKNATVVNSSFNISIITMTSTDTYIDQGVGVTSVTAGSLMYLRIDDVPNGTGSEISTFTISVGQTKTLYAVGYDAYNNYIDNVNVTWDVSNDIGVVVPDDGTTAWTTFTATKSGVGIISANDGMGHVDNTDDLIINAGTLASIKIVEGSSGDGSELENYDMTTDQSLKVHAAGYDANDNYIGDVDVDWSLTAPMGILTPNSNTNYSNFFANSTGTVKIRATHTIVGSDETGNINISVGELNYIKIVEGESGESSEINAVTIQAGDSLKIHAAGYDADDNYISDEMVNWEVQTFIGSVDPVNNSVFSNFYAEKVGTGYIKATHSTAGEDLTGVFTVTPGLLHHIVIETGLPDKRVEVRDTTLHINQMVEFYAAGYDENNNFVRNVNGNWQHLGNLDLPALQQGTKISFMPTTPGSEGKIICDSLNVAADTTGLIHIGSVDQIVITTVPGEKSMELKDIEISADDSLVLYASGFDLSGNYVGTVDVDWQITNLQPQLGVTSDSYVFNPSTANLSGLIIADHPTAIDDSSGVISVIPGAPFGRFKLIPESLELASNGADTINFSSTILQDSDDNVVDSENLMTINYSPSSLGLTIIPSDEKPNIRGHQLGLEDNSTLRFAIVSGNIGGSASISVNSLWGSAHADTLIKVSDLRIISVHADIDSVSQGQQNTNINMIVKNTGAETIHSIETSLRFRAADGTNQRNDYVFNDITIDTLIEGEERLLVFPVSVQGNAKPGLIYIDGYAEGMTMSSVVLQDTSANTNHSWYVTSPAQLRILSIKSSDIVEQGTLTTLRMRVTNAGGATAVVQADSLEFYKESPYVDVTGEYSQIPKHNNPFLLHNDEIKELEYTVTIGTNSTKGDIVIDGKISGIDKNSNKDIIDLTSDTTSTWEVKKKGEIDVLSFSPSQEFINLGQNSSWFVTMKIENEFETIDLVLDSTKLEFYAGTDNITSQFDVINPIKFQEYAGTDTLYSNSLQTLKFEITHSSEFNLGNIRFSGRAYLSDIAHSIVLASAEEQVIIKEPSLLSLKAVEFSQNEVTRSQGKDWYVNCLLENQGSSPIKLLLDSSDSNIKFSNQDGYIVVNPTSMILSETDTLNSQAQDTLRFTIDSTGVVEGENQIRIKINYVDIVAEYDTLEISNSEKRILVESKPHIVIQKTENVSHYAPSVNTEQLFDIMVVVQNQGDDAAIDNIIYVGTDGNSQVLPSAPFSIEGNETDSIYVQVVADSTWTLGEIFSSSIVETHSENTPEFDDQIVVVAEDDTAKAVIQRPADISIINVVPSETSVKALSSGWEIGVIIRRTGAGTVLFDAPGDSSIQFYHNDVLQTDYLVTEPTKFEKSGTLFLSGWEMIEDTLLFNVDQAGLMGGEIAINVSLTGTYMNNDSSFIVEKSAIVNIEPTASIRILTTEPVCPNKIDEIGYLSTEQNFEVRVTLQNTGDEAVENVRIGLESGGDYYQQTIENIAKQSQYAINFSLTAPELEQKIQYIAEIESATSSLSGVGATIGAAVDSIAVFQIQDKAALSVRLYEVDAVLTLGQISPVRYIVENNGTAATDSSGKVMVSIPDGYKVQNGENLDSASVIINFITGVVDTLFLMPPNVPSSGDELQMTINTPPRDVNMGLPAYVESYLDMINLKTVSSNLNCYAQIIWPNGASDNILSTNQLFDVQATIEKSDDIKSTQASVTLPYGYHFDFNEDSIKTVATNSVKWRIRSPEIEHLENRSLIIKTVGFNGENEYIVRDTLELRNEKKARLYISDVGIISPPQTDSTLVVGQSFTVSATIINEGLASVTNKGLLKISFGSTGVTTSQDTIKQFTVGNPVLWDLRAPSAEAGKGKITFSIEDVPDDGNTNQPAEGLGDRRTISIKTVNKGYILIDSLKIVEPAGALDNVLSTKQIFNIKAYLRWNNCENVPNVTIKMPDNFITEIESKNPQGAYNQGTVTWSVTTPSEPVDDSDIWVESSARDTHSGESIGAVSTATQVDVVRRAEISLNADITSPIDAVDGIVTTNQTFKIQANLWTSGDASIEDFYTLRLTLPQGGGYFTEEPKDKRVLHNEVISWTIAAPSSPRDADLIRIDLVEAPHDENTNQNLENDAIIDDSRAIPIATEEKTIDINLVSRKEQNSLARGDTNVTMLTFNMLASGDENSSRVLFRGLRVAIRDRSNLLFENINRAISTLSVVSQNENYVLGTVPNLQGSGLIDITFDVPDTLKPSILSNYKIKVNISEHASELDFEVGIDSLSYFDIVDISSGEIPILSNVSNEDLTSGFAVIVPKDFEKAFWNYPNPFGSAGREMTTFQYYLDQDSDIQINIYSLLGELVWSKKFLETDPQGGVGLHDGANAIHWNGANNSGEKVLNGVYIAYIKTTYGKTAITKVAILK